MKKFICRGCGNYIYAKTIPTTFQHGECPLTRILPQLDNKMPSKNHRIHQWIPEDRYDWHEFDKAGLSEMEFETAVRNSNTHLRIDIDAIRREEEIETEKALKKQKSNELAALRKKELERQEKKEREDRANELMAEGKNLQAHFVRYKNALMIGASILAIVLFLGYQQIKDNSTEKNGTEINLKLEKIEEHVKLAIQNGDQTKALDLDNQLVHPLHEQWKDQSKFDSWKGYPYYDDYWTQKREEYKTQIFAMSKRFNK